MKQKTAAYLVFILLLTLTVSPREQKNTFQDLQGPYLGQKAPVEKSEVFLDGVISTLEEPEMNAAFTRDGKEFYYCTRNNGKWAIFITREVNGKWIRPVPMGFTSNYTDRDFTMSPDGNRIYFGSNRPKKKGAGMQTSLDIFVTTRLSSTGQWSEPKAIGPPINTHYGENYPCVAGNGNLYFFSCREDGPGGCDIYMAKLVNSSYTTPVPLGSAINSEKNDWDAYIAPDESYIIFSSQNRSDTLGEQDLYISFRKKDKSWTNAKNMGSSVNSRFDEICPSVSLDGKYFFFTGRRRGKADIFWITTDVIEKLK
jgi:Tol biopolymer transport system component